ncbi:thermonuclease family protein [Ancylobacter vacuolatus]|uniref:thermonuclease family protein n=1 Tax=Ancylobacter vacuolatus TaxID=223389 RepID=UPI0036262985
MSIFWRIRRAMRPLQLAMLFAAVLLVVARYDWSGTATRAGREAATLAPAAMSREIVGRATVIDGDTLAIAGQHARIRLFGIDAPESTQPCFNGQGRRYPCGSRATAFLSLLVGRGGNVVCRPLDVDSYQRLVAECDTAAGLSINRAMVRAGWAIDYVRYSGGRYSVEQRDAQIARRGLWDGTFDAPAQWRKQTSL